MVALIPGHDAQAVSEPIRFSSPLPICTVLDYAFIGDVHVMHDNEKWESTVLKIHCVRAKMKHSVANYL